MSADDLLERGVVVEPRAVVADVDRRRDHELLRGVEAVAGQPAALVADEVAALRIGDVVGEAARLQPEAVGQGVMAAHVLDEHRVDAGRLVEVPARRQPAVAEHLRVHADGPDPLAVRRPLGGLGDPRDEVRDGRHAGIPHVDGRELRAREREMVMGVDEARAGSTGPPTSIRGRRAGRPRSTASSSPTATIRSPTIATPPVNGGSPGRAVNTRPLSSTSPRIALIFAPRSLRIASIVPASAADYDASVLMEELAMAAGRAARWPKRRFEHASLDHDRRVLRESSRSSPAVREEVARRRRRGIGARRVGTGPSAAASEPAASEPAASSAALRPTRRPATRRARTA